MGFLGRYRATIAPHILDKHSFRNRQNLTREQELELDKYSVDAMLDKLPGQPFLYNHKSKHHLGKITASFQPSHKNAWVIEYGLYDTPKGRSAKYWIEKGDLIGVSLSHYPHSLNPLEVSACWKGARGPESRTHVSESDELHISKPLFDNSNGQYDTDSGSFLPFHPPVQASSEVPGQASSGFVLFIPLSSVESPVLASNMSASSGTNGAGHAPSKSSGGDPMDTQMTDAQGDTSHASGSDHQEPTKKTGSSVPARNERGQFQPANSSSSSSSSPSGKKDASPASNEKAGASAAAAASAAASGTSEEPELLHFLRQRHAALAATLENSNMSEESRRSIISIFKQTAEDQVERDRQLLRQSQQVEQLMREKEARESAAKAEQEERERKKTEQEMHDKELEAQIAMDYMATFQRDMKEDEKKQYYDKLMGMPLDMLRTLATGQRDVLARAKSAAQTTVSDSDYWAGLKGRYQNVTEPTSSVAAMAPSSSHFHENAPVSASENSSRRPYYEGRAHATSSDKWDPREWVKRRDGHMIPDPRMFVRNDTAQRVMASYGLDTSQSRDNLSAVDREDEVPEYVDGVRIRRDPISASAQMEHSQSAENVRMGEGCRWPMYMIGKGCHPKLRDEIVLATMAVWAGDNFNGSAVRASAASLDLKNLYSKSWLDNLLAYKTQQESFSSAHLENGNESYGSAMQR